MNPEDLFFVLRKYRGKLRVIAMYSQQNPAEERFLRERAKLRDGDLILARGALERLMVESGGYNRTRW